MFLDVLEILETCWSFLTLKNVLTMVWKRRNHHLGILLDWPCSTDDDLWLVGHLWHLRKVELILAVWFQADRSKNWLPSGVWIYLVFVHFHFVRMFFFLSLSLSFVLLFSEQVASATFVFKWRVCCIHLSNSMILEIGMNSTLWALVRVEGGGGEVGSEV